MPLIEIVTEPDLRSAADAAECFSRLREILVALGVNDGNMEEGSLRCDANVSVRPVGATTLGTKAEVKNVNSFRYVQKAIEFEIERQIDLVSQGGSVRQETRLWNSDTDETTSMRSKEEAHDYRYFPEPDLPPLDVSADWVEEIRRSLPELPEARKARYVAALGLSEYDADVLVRAVTGGAEYFEAVLAAGAPAKAASNWIQGEIRRRLKDLGADDISAVPVAARPAGGAGQSHRPGRRQQHGRQGRLRQDVDDRRPGRRKLSSAKAWLRSATNRSSPRSSTTVVGAQPGCGRAVSGRPQEHVGLSRRTGHEGQPGQSESRRSSATS